MTIEMKDRAVKLMFVAALTFIYACNPKVTTNLVSAGQPLDYRQEVIVLGLNEVEPAGAEVLGKVKIGDTGFTTNGSYEYVLMLAKNEARKVGGNVIKITAHQPPTLLGSSCHKLTARIFKVADVESFQKETEEPKLDVDYAILKIYRFSGAGAAVGYDLFLGDMVICRVLNNFKQTIVVRKDGFNTLWARTESKTELPMNIELGKTYYVRCGITMGAFVGRPKLELVDYNTGKLEFESFNAKNQ